MGVSWGVPEFTNGTIRGYEILYTGSVKEDCDSPEVDVVRNTTIPANQRRYQTTNTENIAESKSLLVCVRAHTDKPGQWASSITSEVDLGGLGGDEPASNCNGLIVVAAVASLAIISAAVVATIALVLCKYKNQAKVADDRSNESNQSNQSIEAGGKQRSPSPSRQSNDTGYQDDIQTHPLNKMRSIDSALSNNTTHQLLESNGSLDT